MESLESNGLLSSSTQWTRRAIRTNTRLFYTQEKFNLLREETEGFAKLITDLLGSHRSRDSTTKQHTRLVSLVGCFDLDPNRVVDLIWNASAYCNEKCGELLSLMSTFRSDYISQILGFKFQNCQWNRKSLCTETEESVNFDSTFSPILAENSTVPYSELGPLIEVAAEALSRQLIRLCDIWPHLSPEDSVIFTRLIEFANEVDKTTAEFGVVSLSGGESSLGSRVSRTEQPFKTYEDFEQGPFSEGLFSKIELICALLERGSWNIVVDCMKILSDSGQKNLSDFGQQLCSHPRYRTVLVAIAEQVLEKFLGKTLNLSLSCPSSANNYFLKMKEEKLLMLFGFQGFEDLLHKEVKGAEQKHHALVYILLSLGPYIKQSCRCLFLLCRFVQKQLNESDGVRNLGLRLLVEVIFPAMSCIKGNPALSIELWRTMCLLRFDERYQIYYLVKHSIRQEYSLVRRSNSWTSFETRRVLRRLAKENVKQFGRWLGKICNGNPLIAAECILEQVQSYENLIPVLIDALKYMTPLTFDIIMYSCLEQLDTCNKDKIKSDGMNLSQWYYGLCIFISGLIRKYFAFVDCRGLFHFIFNKLEEGDSVYVFLLLEILSRVSGGGNTEHLSDSQMSSLGGGPLLREIVASALSSSLPETKKVSRKAAEMIKNLVNSEGLVADLAILVAQQKESILFDSVHREIPLRMICNIFDKCQETLILYTDLILGEDKCSHIGGDSDDVESRSESHTNGKPDTLNFPSFQSLVVDYHIPYVSAFLFMRPYLVFENIFNMSPDTSNLSREPFHISCLTKVFPDSMWESISPELFVAFWTLKLYDIHVPKDSYLMELQRLRSMVYDDQVTENDIHSLVRNVKESRRHRQAGRKLEETLSLLEEEMRVHESHYQRIQSLLCERKSFFFTQISNAKNWSIVFLQICLIPRCISSFSDAAFCSKFLEVLLDLDPPGLRILPLFHYLLLNIGEISQCLTEAEATRFGNFVAEVLKILNEWWMNENKYNAECHKRLAFSLEVNEEQGSGIKYSEFATWNREVHSVMTKSMLSNLDSDNYLDIRNSIEILSRVIKYFPRIESHGLLIQRKLQEVIENKNETFRVVASRYLSLLQNERGNWISHAEVDPIDSVKLKGDLLDTNFLHSFRHLYNSEVSTMFSQKSEPTQMTPEEMEEMHIDEQIEKQNTQITVEQDSSSAMPEQSVYDEELQVASTHLEDPKTMSILEVNEKMDSSHITDPTHAELARIQAAVAEKRQLLQREREKRNRLPEQNAKEELSLKNATKETPEPGEITKGSSRSVYKKEPSSSRDSSDDLEARKRRRGLVEEEGANASDTNRRNKRERTDAVTSSRNDIMNASRAKDTLSSSRSYSPGSRTYSGAIGDSNRNRNSRSSYVSQERVFREGESSNRVRRPSVSEQREKKAEDPDNREAYSSTRMSSRSRKSRK
ncbi:THO complex subunit 2 [Galdieria sulphuraria]|uniref:THO complex subunit 2 n=1 Tax=Galdieria sulphuraria TaxID=130081 RepID=M2W9W5_GALSU|nr:THO complex subunit 2 [Galdieria sulphuraria]EME32701.1 THO complex subunit 2 [Galdieria sulphuraria]|eukprot:XP_005709221.1 THO complex subunit 2 [Galdieria sulphuraria]